MFRYDGEKCIHCGLCEKVCSYRTGNIRHSKEGVIFEQQDCFHCGQCIAVCPAGALSNDEYDSNEWMEKKDAPQELSSESLQFAMEFRRSIRHFTEKPVSKEILQQVINAGRYAPSGGNRQKLRYIVLQQDLEEFRRIIVDGFARLQESGELEKILNYNEGYLAKWKEIIEEDRSGHRIHDRFLFHAGTVILTCGPKISTLEAGMALQNMDLMANALGLGCCYVGFLRTAAMYLPKVREYLELPEEELLLNGMVIGYPAIRFQRTTIKRPVKITFR